MRGTPAFAAATLLLPLALTPAVAHIATPFARPLARVGIAAGHFSSGRFHVFNRFGAGRFGSNRFGFDRFDNYHFDFGRFGPNRFRYNRFAANAGPLDFGLLGFGGGGGGDWGYPPAYPTAPPAPIVFNAGGPPVAINVYAGGGTGPGEVGAADGAACPVVHLLEYDKAGHYTGERQIPGC
jgi:hypothetical protein